MPRRAMLSQEQRDRRRADWSRPLRARAAGTRPTGETRPRHLAAEAEEIQHRRLVALDASRQDVPFPRAGGQFDSVELRDHGPKPLEARQAVRRRDVLPRKQEAHELRWRDRLDLGAQPVQCSRWIRASSRRSHHSSSLRSGRERTAQHDAVRLERQQRSLRSPAERPNGAARAPAVTGPSSASRPRSSSTIASSRFQVLARRVSGAAIAGII